MLMGQYEHSIDPKNRINFQMCIRDSSQKVSGSDDIARVATISSGDEAIGKLIADAMEKVSADGVITLEESKTAETYSEVVEGMQFDRGYITPYMVTDTEKMEAVIDDAYILITDKKIASIQEILPLLEEIVKAGKKLVDVYKRQALGGLGAQPQVCFGMGSPAGRKARWGKEERRSVGGLPIP